MRNQKRPQRIKHSALIPQPSVLSLALCSLLFALCSSVRAQQPNKVPRIGYLTLAPRISDRREAFLQGLRDLGYVERKNIVIEWRFAEAKLDRAPVLATELVHLKVDIIVTAGPIPTRFAKEATPTIPIVMTQDTDPVGNGFVASLARPGGNITGLATLSPELSGKRLELLKEIVPKLSRIAVVGQSTYPGNAQNLRETEIAAEAFGVTVQYLDVLNSKDIEIAFRGASKNRSDAALVLPGPLTTSQRIQIAELAVKNRLPLMYSGREHVDVGGLMYYGPSFTDLSRRAATYVDKILRGAQPADLPVERPRKFDLAINLRTANQIGVTIPPDLLYRADKVIN
jgi:putative tryptophan/tyrosine transport system substrate-binding protein